MTFPQPKARANAPESSQRANGYVNPVPENAGNRTSRALAIKAMCAHCVGCTPDHIEPGFREEIRNCSAPNCPLWHFRPYQTKKAPVATEAEETIPVREESSDEYTATQA